MADSPTTGGDEMELIAPGSAARLRLKCASMDVAALWLCALTRLSRGRLTAAWQSSHFTVGGCVEYSGTPCALTKFGVWSACIGLQ
jgi:hypothetical protein